MSLQTVLSGSAIIGVLLTMLIQIMTIARAGKGKLKEIERAAEDRGAMKKQQEADKKSLDVAHEKIRGIEISCQHEKAALEKRFHGLEKRIDKLCTILESFRDETFRRLENLEKGNK